MSSKLDYILQLFEKNDFRHRTGSLEKIRESAFRKSLWSMHAEEVYQALGGTEKTYPWKEPEWQLEFENVVVQLDEEPHFNRYRAITLQSSLYKDFKSFSVENYKRFCRQFEQECLKAARNERLWTDRESEMLFGRSEAPGDLALKGSAKWKARAFFDFLQDASIHLAPFKLIRISVHENIMINNKLIKLDNLLVNRGSGNEKYLWNYLQRRLEPPIKTSE